MENRRSRRQSISHGHLPHLKPGPFYTLEDPGSIGWQFSCIDTVYCVIHFFVCLFFPSLFYPSVRPSVRSLVRSCVFVRLLARLIDDLFFFFVKCFARPFSLMVSPCLWSSSIPAKFFFFFLHRHPFPWSSINEILFFPLLHQSRGNAWWQFSCKNKLILF